MLSYKVRSRFSFFLFIILSLSFLIFIVLSSLEESFVYFFSPTEIYNKENLTFNTKIRVGGLVKENSIIKKKGSKNQEEDQIN